MGAKGAQGLMSQYQAVEDFLGVGFHVDSLKGAAGFLMAQDHAAPFRYVVTPNVQHMVMILENPLRYADLYKSAWRIYCDSRVMSRLARLLGRRLPVVTGSDLTAELLEQARAAGLKIAVIGPPAADCAKLAQRYPGLRIASHTPPQGFIQREEEIAACIDFVLREKADFVFIAVGMPRQEILAKRLTAVQGARGIGLCVGASIDFLTGKQQRAPIWMQLAGFEWLHRLLSDPRRLAARYLLQCPKFFFLAAREYWRAAHPLHDRPSPRS